MKLLLSAAAAVGLLAAASSASAITWPAYGYDSSGPGIIITINADNSVTVTNPDGPYDGGDDTYVGVINNGTTAIGSLKITGVSYAFSWDGDGIDTYGAPGNSKDTSGYGGPNAYFTGITPDFSSGTVNFIKPIASGGYDYFSLEEGLTAASFSTGSIVTGGGGIPEPATWALTMAGLFGMGAVLRRKARVARELNALQA
jgi:hypothetical protein